MLETGMKGLPILLLSDSTFEAKDSGLFEYAIGSLMQKQPVDWSAGRVAATLFIALPEAIHNTLNGHWAKVLFRGDISAADRQNIEIAIYRILEFVQARLSQDGKLVNKPLWSFRPLVV
jgi:hypothetical protein